MFSHSNGPPKKRARSEQQQADDFSDSDDSFNDPVLAEPSQITQTILHRREANRVDEGTQRQIQESSLTATSQPHNSPLGRSSESDVKTWISFSRQASVTPRRFNVQRCVYNAAVQSRVISSPHLQDKEDYHQNGQLLMLRNRVENMEREKERLAAATRDQIIFKEKQHSAELAKKDERIRQLETQIQSLRQESLQTSFQSHNVTLSGNAEAEMADGISGAPLPVKRVVFSRHDRWKAGIKFGAGTSVFAPTLSTDRFESLTGAETFTHIPSQVLMETRVSNVPLQNGKSMTFEKVRVRNEEKECNTSAIDDDWDVRKWMCESSLESLLSISLVSQESNFDLYALRKLCQVKDFLELKSCLRPKDA